MPLSCPIIIEWPCQTGVAPIELLRGMFRSLVAFLAGCSRKDWFAFALRFAFTHDYPLVNWCTKRLPPKQEKQDK